MVVRSVTRPAIGGVAARRRGSDGRAFGVSAEKSPALEGPSALPAVTMTSLLSMQEAESGLQQDREARRHGTAMVDELTGLQHALLSDGAPDLQQLATLAARPVRAADPGLAGLLQAVRLRAGIELARRGHAVPV